MAKKTNPSIVVDGVVREMTKEELEIHFNDAKEIEQILNAEKAKKEKKEIAIAKLVALGLTEEDLRTVGM